MGISALLASQILDASATGRSVLTGADASAIRTTLGLGTLATQSPTGTPSASTFLRGDYSWQTIDLSGYVPYSGATGPVNLGSNAFTASRATLATGTIAASTPAIDISQTWNNAAINFVGAKIDVNTTTSGGSSNIIEISRNGTPAFYINKYGEIRFFYQNQFNPGFGFAFPSGYQVFLGENGTYVASLISAWINMLKPLGFGANWYTPDVFLNRDDAGTLGIRNSTNAQRLNLYGTFTDASNYRRLFLSSTTAGAFTLGVEGAGTGASGNGLEILANGITAFSISSSGGISATAATSNFSSSNYSGQIRFTSPVHCRLASSTSDGTLQILRNDASTPGQLQVGDITASRSLSLNSGTITASTPFTITQTWNNAATTFTGILSNVTDTASNAASLLMDLQVGGTSKFSVNKSGSIVSQGGLSLGSNQGIVGQGGTRVPIGLGSTGYFVVFNSGAAVASAGVYAFTASADPSDTRDLILARDAAQTLAQRNGTNPQVHRVYNTFTDSSNYERAKVAWESNVLRIGTEKSGTGSARALELQTDGTTRLTVATNGNLTGAGLTLDNSNSQNIGLDVRPWITIKNNSATLAGYLSNGGSIFSSGASGTTDLGLRAVGAFGISVNNSQTPTITISSASLVTIADASDIAVGTTTGTKIGTATTQKIGFYNKTPVVQPTAVADATDAASVITQLNALLSRMRDLGLIAT